MLTRSRRLGLCLALALPFWATGPVEAADEVFRIFVAPDGNNASSGHSADKAVASLQRALKVYDTQCEGRATEIVIAPGTYADEKLTLKRAPCPLSIDSGKPGVRPKFAGKGDGTWLLIDMPGAKMVKLSISNLEIVDYQSVVSINGDRDQPGLWVGGVRLINNRFAHIGSFRNEQKPATAAIRLVNARFNVIEGNEFESIRNLKSCGGLHSVYMAHLSSNNVIQGNRFVDGCGDTVKARDGSSNNVVRNNRFERQEGNALFLDSFCDKLSRDDCTKPSGECPSWDNVFEDNAIAGTRPKSNKETTKARRVVSDLSSICPAPPSKKMRIIERSTSTR